jgi:hypothetical protein
MDTNENFGCYINKDQKVINAIYFLGRYVDPGLITSQVEKLAALAATVTGIVLFIIYSIT